jgi:glutaconate CoA-transferase subunit B
MAATDATPTEGLIFTIAGLLQGVGHVAVGASSPIPGAAALLTRTLAERDGRPPVRLSILGSKRDHSFTNGGVEIFDLAAQGRIDAFFLGGGQIDGQANINLVGTGPYPQSEVRWPGSFGSAYLYHLVPRVILFREEHTRRVFVPQVDFVSAAGPRDDGVYRPGGPHALLTRLCLFGFDKARRRFVLRSVHPGHTLEEVRDSTGFDFDAPAEVPPTPMPDAATLALIRGPVREQIGRTYPKFASAQA